MSVLHVLPTEKSKQSQIKFINYKFCTIAPFDIYADFESILEPLRRQANQTTYNQQHKECAAAAIICSTLGRYNQLTVMKVGENALSEFLKVLIEWETAILDKLRSNRPVKRMSAQQREKYENATQCYFCRHALKENNPKLPKVRDHDHITEFFIGAAQRQCNLERPVSFRIPVFFHNFHGYDAQLIVHEFGNRPKREIKVIGQNMEKYLQVELGINMVYCDSLQFLLASLEQLTTSLAKTGCGNFYNYQEVVAQIYPESDVELLERKGLLCYDYIDLFARLDEPALPPREAFFNNLGGVECSAAEYTHAKHVFTNLQCESLKVYMQLYLLSDICLLADVFQMFRNNSLDEYQLDPAYFVSAP